MSLLIKSRSKFCLIYCGRRDRHYPFWQEGKAGRLTYSHLKKRGWCRAEFARGAWRHRCARAAKPTRDQGLLFRWAMARRRGQALSGLPDRRQERHRENEALALLHIGPSTH